MALAQVMPTSFVLNLFYIAQLRAVRRPHYPTVTMSQRTIFATAGIYCGILFATPYIAAKPFFLPLTLLARLMLIIPFYSTKSEFLADGHPNPEGDRFGLYTAQVVMESAVLVLTAKQGNAIVQREFEWSELVGSLFINPAVTAYGLDLILSLFTYGTWLGIQRISFPDDEEPKDEKDK